MLAQTKNELTVTDEHQNVFPVTPEQASLFSVHELVFGAITEFKFLGKSLIFGANCILTYKGQTEPQQKKAIYRVP